jgi:thiol-disulfide isomerase/thioredoxin
MGAPVLSLAAKNLLGRLSHRPSNDPRPVFVLFTATWCGACHRLEALLSDPQVSPIFERRFALVKLNVEEGDLHRNLVQSGAEDLERYLFVHGGLPCYFVLDRTGRVIALSIGEKGGLSIGYPGKEDISLFLSILDSSGSPLTPAERKTITGRA